MQKYNLYHKKLSLWHDPEQVFLALYADKKYSFWLDNKDYSYMGLATKRIKYTLSNHTLSISNNGKTQKLRQGIFTYLQKELANSKFPAFGTPFNKGGWGDFTGGFVGYFGYEMKAECLPSTFTSHLFMSQLDPGLCGATFNSPFPDAFLFFIDKFLAFDHRQKCLYLVTVSKNKKKALHWLSAISMSLRGARNERRGNPVIKKDCFISQLNQDPRNDSLTFTPSRSRRQYLKDIRACQKHLAAGNTYQICLTNQITTNIKTNWLALFRTLRATNPAPASAYINFGNFALLSSSPEQFLKVDKKGWVTSKPMKGTVRRGETIKKDKLLAKNLGKTEKDYAENIMIVDLVRSDLGKVCVVGSIKVTKPLEVQSYATVHQLVSTIKGKLHPGATIIDLLEASFPGGSMTGAPKISASEIIAKLENAPRGIYSGTFGFLSLNGTANLAMTIRTIIATKDQLSFGTGGAILSDSIPQEEYSEMLLKAQPLMEAIMKTIGAKSYLLNS